MENKLQGGLVPLPKDERDFKLGQIVDQPELSELPDEYIVGNPKVKDQGNSDYCTAFASCSISEIQEGVELSPEYSFALIKQGDIDSWGASLRDAARAHVKYGAIKQVDAPYSLKDKPDDFLRNIDNWGGNLKEKAMEHKKKSYFTTDGKYDAFDNIRTYLWKYRDEKCGAIIGVQWGWPLTQKVINTMPQGGFGHCVAVIGWTKIRDIPHLIIHNSAGESAGENGLHYFSREIINQFIERYGCFMFIDLPKETAEFLIKNQLKEGETTKDMEEIVDFIGSILKWLSTVFKKLFGIM